MHIKRKRKLIKFLNLLDQPVRFNPFVFSRIFLLWVLLGLIGGLITGGYWIILEFLTDKMALLRGWQVIPTMAISGFLAGLVIHFIGDPGEINLVVNNIRFNKGKLDPRNNPSMILSSLLCVSSGGSLGPEAPMVQVTGSMGSWIGKIFRIKGEELRSLTIAGMASGFTALFGAPLGGSLFSLEILHHKHAVEYYKAIIPALVASCISFIVFVIIIHTGLVPVWKLPAYQYNGAFDFVYAVTFAIVATIVGWGFIYCTKMIKAFFEKLHMPIYISTLVGGLILGTIAYHYPLTRYFGHHQINELLNRSSSINLLVAILIFKIIAISVTVTSGWRGGFIIPLFFVGTTLGLILHFYFLQLTSLASMLHGSNQFMCNQDSNEYGNFIGNIDWLWIFTPILLASLTGYFLAPRIPFIKSQLVKE